MVRDRMIYFLVEWEEAKWFNLEIEWTNENVKQVHRLHKVLEEGGKVIAVKLNIMLLFLVVFFLFYWDISQSS